MKAAIATRLLAAALVLAPAAAHGANVVKIDVLYMNHGPLKPTLEALRTVLAKYGPRVAVAWHDSETEEGQRFMTQKDLRGHIPLVIWVDDSFKHSTKGKEISFAGFPTGSGPAFFQGKWTMDDLKTVLDHLTVKK
jgi:hypothetical protein